MKNLVSKLSRLLPLAAGLAFCAAAAAQGYPNKPIRLIVPYAAGGSTDQLARAIQQPLSDLLGQPVIVDNKPGAGGAIGVDTAAKAAPDGYTLVFGNTGPSATVSLMRKVPYDPLKDFHPISTVVFAPLALAITVDMPVHSFKEFLAYARKQGSAMNYGSVGNGSLSHLTGEYFNSFAGTQMQHVPYNGGSTLLAAMLGGQVNVAWVNPLDGTSMLATGKVRYLAIATPTRFEALPDVPTIAADLPGFKSTAWFGVLVPKGTPEDVVKKLNAAIVAAVANPAVRRILLDRKVEPHSSTPQELEKIIQDEQALWGPVIRQADIRM